MAATFCFTTKAIKDHGSYTATFQSSDGEEYVLKYNRIDDNYCGCDVTLEWKNKSSKFIRFSSFSENSKRFVWHKNLFVKDNIQVSLYIGNAQSGGFFITVTPLIHLIKYGPSFTKPGNQMLGTTKEKAIAEKRLEQLSTDMGSLLETGNLSDVVLSDGTKEIRAHKLMLSARSSVFAKMFLHPMKENRENRITIQDISIEVVEELLHFMYSGTVVIKTSKMARDLYVAADKYDVRELRDICTGMLKSVDLDNVLDALLLADMHSDKTLKEAALHFISENYSQLKALDNWNGFMEENQAMAIEILSFIVDKKTTNVQQI